MPPLVFVSESSFCSVVDMGRACPLEHLAQSLCPGVSHSSPDLLKLSPPEQEPGAAHFNKCPECLLGPSKAGNHWAVHGCFSSAEVCRISGAVPAGVVRFMRPFSLGRLRWFACVCPTNIEQQAHFELTRKIGSLLYGKNNSTQSTTQGVCSLSFQNNLRRQAVELLLQAAAAALLVSSCFV